MTHRDAVVTYARSYVQNIGSAQERTLMTQDGINGIWDGLNDGCASHLSIFILHTISHHLYSPHHISASLFSTKYLSIFILHRSTRQISCPAANPLTACTHTLFRSLFWCIRTCGACLFSLLGWQEHQLLKARARTPTHPPTCTHMNNCS